LIKKRLLAANMNTTTIDMFRGGMFGGGMGGMADMGGMASMGEPSYGGVFGGTWEHR
jgi:hypothetical protein